MPVLLYETVHGSRAYNLARPGSDTDLKGIVVGPRSWYLGFLPSPEQLQPSKDHVRYEIRKFMRLAAAANPTVIEVLWTDPRHHLTVTDAGRKLLAARGLLLSKRVRGSFGKYAVGQLKRINTHRGWLADPPTKAPTRAEFGLPDAPLTGSAAALSKNGPEGAASPSLVEQEKRYRAAKHEWEHYQTWLRSRNAKRAALEERFGYDTKHAQHLVRLLKMATEILETHHVHVWREDREELLAIRAGALSYEQLIERVTALEAAMAAAAAASTLPEVADREALDALCVDLVANVLADL